MLLTRDTIACQVLAEWLEDQTEWLLLVQLTLQKGGFRQGNPMLLKDAGMSLLKSPTKACYTFLAAGSLRAAALLPLRLLLRLLVSAAAY